MLARVGLEMAWVEAAARGTMTVVTGALEEAEAARTLERRSDEADVRIILYVLYMRKRRREEEKRRERGWV